MRIVRLALSLYAAVALAACASPGVPPGGPVDTEAPEIVNIAPDSGRTDVTPREVVFRFDETVSERPTGAQSLSGMFLISPRDGEPRVDWSRREVSIRPRGGWRPNTAYTITMLPGLSDLRGNVRNTGAVTIFSTGATIPAGRITGRLFSWSDGRIAPRGLVEARTAPDTTLVYVTNSDSTGAFVIGNLAPGPYLVRGLIDDNNNRGVDPREAWDTVSETVTDSARVELLAFLRDSIGARLSSVTARDSVTLELAFDNPLAPAQPLTAANVRVTGRDSVDVPIAAVSPPPPDTAVTGVIRPSRPSPVRTMVVRLGRPLLRRTEYRVRVSNVRNLIGVARDSERTVTLAAPAAPPPAPPTVPPASPPAAPPPAPPATARP